MLTCREILQLLVYASFNKNTFDETLVFQEAQVYQVVSFINVRLIRGNRNHFVLVIVTYFDQCPPMKYR